MSLTEHDVMPTLRRILLGIFVLGILGTGAELLLLEHTEDPWQFVPLVLIALSLVVLLAFSLRRSPASLRLFRYVVLLFVASGLVGLRLHYQANVEFELEMYSSLSGWELFCKSITGAIPVLAPGAMVQLGLLGWVYTFRHPLLRDSSAAAEKEA